MRNEGEGCGINRNKVEEKKGQRKEETPFYKI